MPGYLPKKFKHASIVIITRALLRLERTIVSLEGGREGMEGRWRGGEGEGGEGEGRGVPSVMLAIFVFNISVARY